MTIDIQHATHEDISIQNGFSAFEYPFDTQEINIAEVVLTNRYPKDGFVSNRECDMFVRVLYGEVELAGTSTQILKKGDVVHVKRGTLYSWSPISETCLYIVSSPPWDVKQTEHVNQITPPRT